MTEKFLTEQMYFTDEFCIVVVATIVITFLVKRIFVPSK